MKRIASAALGALEEFVGVGALVGGGLLFFAPTGGAFLHLPNSLLAPTPFRDFRIPGLILFGVNGVINTVAGVIAFRRHPSAAIAGLVAGTVQIGWIAGEIAIIGYVNWAQILYFGLGVATLSLALALRRVSTRPS